MPRLPLSIADCGADPGDRLLFAAGTYTQGLPIHNKHGQPGKCIVFEGPASGSPALFTGSDSWNVVSLKDSSYIAVRNLSLDGWTRRATASRPRPPRCRCILYPKSGQLQGTAIDYSPFSGLLDYNRDFNGQSRVTTYRGAYSGDGVNPGWTPALAIKPEPSAPPPELGWVLV